MSKLCIVLKIGIVSKEVNIVPVLAILEKYTVPAIKPVPVLLQNVPEKITGCIGLFQLYRPVLASIGVLVGIIRKYKIEKKFIKKHYI